MGKEEKTKRKEGKDSGGLDLEREENEMETGKDSKGGRKERKEGLGRVWENQN